MLMSLLGFYCSFKHCLLQVSVQTVCSFKITLLLVIGSQKISIIEKKIKQQQQQQHPNVAILLRLFQTAEEQETLSN